MEKLKNALKKGLLMNSSRQKLSDVLIKLMDECDVDSAQLEQSTGVPASTINRFRSDENCNPTLASLTPLADFFCITVSQLIGEAPLDKNRIVGTYNPPYKAGLPIPVLTWQQAIQWPQIKNKQKSLDLNKWVSIDGSISDSAVGLIMQGDSMEPRFPDGTLLIFDPKQFVENRDFVLVFFKDQKKLAFRQLLADGSDKYLKSLNHEFKEIKKLQSEANYKILGVVVQTRMDFKDIDASLTENKSYA